jgi:hypothetical protein
MQNALYLDRWLLSDEVQRGIRGTTLRWCRAAHAAFVAIGRRLKSFA